MPPHRVGFLRRFGLKTCIHFACFGLVITFQSHAIHSYGARNWQNCSTTVKRILSLLVCLAFIFYHLLTFIRHIEENFSFALWIVFVTLLNLGSALYNNISGFNRNFSDPDYYKNIYFKKWSIKVTKQQRMCLRKLRRFISKLIQWYKTLSKKTPRKISQDINIEIAKWLEIPFIKRGKYHPIYKQKLTRKWKPRRAQTPTSVCCF